MIEEPIDQLTNEEILKPEIKVDEVETKTEKQDEFAYINKGFTSEIFKIEIKNLPKHYGAAALKQLLNEKIRCNPSKVKMVKPGLRFAFACFRNEEDREAAIEKITGYEWKGQKLLAIKSKPSPDPLVKKRNQEQQEGNEPKKQKTLEESTTPLAHLTYEEQLKQKQDEVRKLLKDFGYDYWKCAPEKRDHIQEQRKLNDGLACKLLDLKPSPVQDGYRNKCEFTIGTDSTGKITVGQRFGSYVHGSTEVGQLDTLKHISQEMKNVAKIFEKFIEKSGLPEFNNETHQGYWKCLLVRQSFSSGEIMLSVGLNPQDMSDEDLSKLKQDLVRFFSEEDGKNSKVTSLYFQKLKKRGPGEQFLPYEFLWGTSHITDEILGLKFRISPQSFFQINNGAASVLYETIMELAGLNEKTILLDVCCGIGTIGLCLSKHCKKVQSVEIISEAIEDAKFNANANNISNCTFTCANSNDWIQSAGRGDLEEGDEVVAIVDPPRAGLHDRSIAQIRNHATIQKLVYVSCSPKSVFKNFLDLCRPSSRTLHGRAFTPKVAVAVDLFPHTTHMELVVLFERDPVKTSIAEKEASAQNSTENN